MNNNEFLKKRREYLNQLKNNLELLTQLSKNNNLGSKIVDILLDPKNNKELAFAIDYFNNYEMVQKIVRMIRYGQLVISSPEESNAFNYVYEYIKACLNNVDENEIKKILEKYQLNNFENCAKMLLEMPLVFSDYDVTYTLLEKLGMVNECDEIDELSILKVNNYLTKSQKELSLDNFMDINSDEDFENYFVQSKKYQQICIDFIENYSVKYNK